MRLRTAHALSYLHKLDLHFLSSSRNFSHFLKNPKFHSQISNFPPPDYVLKKIEASQFYFFVIHLNNFHGPGPRTLHTLHVPNIMSNSHSLHRSKGSVRISGCVKCLVTQ